jgi:hypothetical protein
VWHPLFTEKTLATGTHWSETIGLWDNKSHHAFEYKITGNGTIAVTPYTSVTGKHWVNNGTKVTGVGATSGPDSDGADNIPMSVRPSELIKFKIVVSTASVILTLWFTQK